MGLFNKKQNPENIVQVPSSNEDIMIVKSTDALIEAIDATILSMIKKKAEIIEDNRIAWKSLINEFKIDKNKYESMLFNVETNMIVGVKKRNF